MNRRRRRRDVIDVRQERPPGLGPTPEQMKHALYVEGDIVDGFSKGGIPNKIGKAHRLVPRFECIDGLGESQLRALRYYRGVFDRSEISETRCALDVRPSGGGGSDAAIAALEVKAFAGTELRALEAGIGGAVHSLRDVALHDMTFSELAIKRYGSRQVSRIETGKGWRAPKVVDDIAPKSGRHREAVRQEFFVALARLMVNAEPYLRANGGRVSTEK